MKREVHDVRLLKLAELYESAYERFVLDLAQNSVFDDDVRAKLLTLVEGPDRHRERVVELLEKLNARLTEEDREAVTAAAALDVVEVERAARDFYRRAADQVHDGEVAHLFRELADEESRHVRIAEEAVALAGSHERAPGEDPLDFPHSGNVSRYR